MKLRLWLEIFILLWFVFLVSCAKKGFPPGGPEDLTPPQVLEVYPENNSLNVDTFTFIWITFNERMDKGSTEKSIFTTPVPESPFEFSWKKNKLFLKPKEFLEKNRTYVINIGASAKDLHNNKMDRSYSFAFSTGEKLDSGFISGKTFYQSRSEKGVSVWSYPLLKNKEPDPMKERPEYATLSGENGEYTLSYLSLGSYRLFAVKDMNNDLLWDPDKEPIGITTKDINLTSESLSFSAIDFSLSLRDTTPPTLLNCETLYGKMLRLEFNEPLSLKGLYDKDNYKLLSDSLEGGSLRVESVYTRGEEYQKVYLLIEKMAEKNYEVKVYHLSDPSGNKISQGNECFFKGTELEDKTPLKIIKTYPQKGASNILLEGEVKIFFDKPPERNSAEKGFILEDSLNQKIEGKFQWENPAILGFLPDKPLQGKMKYQLTLKELVDFLGNPLADTSFKLTFSTLDPDTLGSISGNVEILDENKGEIIINLEKLGPPEIKYEKKLKEPGEFKFENVFPGKYNLKAYLDLNGNMMYDFGKPLSFEPAEPQIFYPDTLNIRPRWETEGIILKFR